MRCTILTSYTYIDVHSLRDLIRSASRHANNESKSKLNDNKPIELLKKYSGKHF